MKGTLNTSRFTGVVGQHMHAYLVALRLAHACRLLLITSSSIKAVAHESGFSGPARMAGVFRSHVGVSPSEYRRIFAAP